tara:strand:- start:134 stop:430 length:297 start_codon:yes stop_codon:yes gene_type:complete
MYRPIYKNISSATTETLITKNSGVSGSVNKITISNHHDTSANVINLYLYDGTNTYVIVETSIPAQTTLVLDDNLRFDSNTYNLKITTSSSADLTIIIK